MLANIVRLAVLPMAWGAAVHGSTLLTLIGIATIGEMAAFSAGLLFLKYKSGLSLRDVAMHITLAFAFLLLMAGVHAFFDVPYKTGDGQWPRLLVIIPFLGIVISMKELLKPFRAYTRSNSR